MLLLARQGNTEWFGQNGMRQRSQGEEVCWIETSCGEGGGEAFLFFSFLPPIQTKTDKAPGIATGHNPAPKIESGHWYYVHVCTLHTCRISLTSC